MKKPPLIKSVRVTGPATLEIDWSTGESLSVDLAESIKNYPAFVALNDQAVFATAKADEWGHGIEWPGHDDCEIGADSLYELCHEQAGIYSANAFADWMDRIGASNETAAKILGMSRRMIINYRTGSKPIPKVVTLACLAFSSPAKAAAKKPSRKISPEERYRMVAVAAYFISERHNTNSSELTLKKGAQFASGQQDKTRKLVSRRHN